MLGLYKDTGKENGSYYIIVGYIYWGYSRQEGYLLCRHSIGIINIPFLGFKGRVALQNQVFQLLVSHAAPFDFGSCTINI